MQSVNGAQFLNITFLFLLLGAAVVPVFSTVIVPLNSSYKPTNLTVTIFIPKFKHISYFLIFHYYTIILNVRSLIFFCLSFGDINLF